MALQRVPLNNFRGGLNTRDSPFELQPNESPDLLNVTISALVGQLESRKGSERLDTAGMPESEQGAPDFAKQVVIGNGKRFLMLSINGGIYALKPSGEVIKLFAGTAGTIWDFELFSDAAFKDWVYCGNGVDAMQKWDGEAVATVEWKATIGTIPKGGVLCVWENRMFISFVTANVQRIFFSEFGDPEATLKEYGFVDVRGPEDDLDAIQDLCVLGARLIILKRRDVFFISSSVTMLNRRIGGPGVWGRFQVAELEDKLYFLNPQGIFSTGGVQVTMESGSINNFFPEHVTQAHLDKARLIATKDTYPRLLVTLPTDGSAVNNELIEMIPHINFRRIGGRRYLLLPAFMLHSIITSALATWNPTGNKETVVGGSVIGTLEATAIVDTFIRPEENPISNGAKWKVWAWVAKAGMIGKKVGAVAEGLVSILSKSMEGARWSVAEITNPTARLDLTKVPNITGIEIAQGYIALHICYAAAAQSGYTLRVAKGKKLPAGVEWHVSVEKWAAGVESRLLPLIHIPTTQITNGSKIAFRLLSGILTAWLKTSETSPWEKLAEVADATYTKGYSGYEFISNTAQDVTGDGVFHNFATGKSEVVGRLSTLFVGTTDEGIAINAHWQSAWIGVQSEEPFERLRRLNVELSGDVIVDVFKDFESNAAFTQTLPKEGEREEYNEPPGEELAYRFTRVRPEVRGRFHAVKFRSDPEGLPFLINTAELVVRGGKEH